MNIVITGHSCGGGAVTRFIRKVKKEGYKNVSLKKVLLLDTGGCKAEKNFDFTGIDCVNVYQRNKSQLYGLSLEYKNSCKNIEIKQKNIGHFNIAGRNEYLNPLVDALGGYKGNRPRLPGEKVVDEAKSSESLHSE